MTKYRPEGWEQPEVTIKSGEGSTQDILNKASYEAGADAMLNALKEQSLAHLNIGLSDDDIITIKIPAAWTKAFLKGTLVFIPDKDGE